MQLNTDKTEVLVVSSRVMQTLPSHSFTFPDSSPIQPARSVKGLGAQLNCTMTVDSQISSMVSSVSNQLRNIRRVRPYLTRDIVISTVRSLVLSRLDFHNGLLLNAPQYQIQRLQRLENAAARLVYNVRSTARCTPLLRELHWLPVKYRIDFKIAILTFKALQTSVPEYIQNMIEV